MKCPRKHKNRTCIFEEFHDKYCQDKNGFKFLGEKYPDVLGNGPSGYPMNNQAFDAAVAKVKEDRKEDAEKAKRFLELLRQVLRKSADEN